MKTISSVVEHYIKKKPFLQSALAQGIINLTSLSENRKTRRLKRNWEKILEMAPSLWH
ncbi:hypothetical protein [Maribacter litopenaei]|uniref:hypothetical protein n=1 Tax=Maribacter litopenaei TaxID=2976127 RepID=UPI003B8463B0